MNKKSYNEPWEGMKTFSDFSKKLTSHMEFDPNAFIGDDKISQELCNFILALALIYNDFKYYNINYIMLMASKPESDVKRISVWGEHAGFKFHLFRLTVSCIHELFNLIKKNKEILDHPFFNEVVRLIPKSGRDSWDALVEVALNKNPSFELFEPLVRIRNKMLFHYDKEELFSGYKEWFFKEEKITQDACISIGADMPSARFYFADGAVQGYINKRLDKDAKIFIDSLNKIMVDINMALFNICERFIQRRGFAWKIPKENAHTPRP